MRAGIEPGIAAAEPLNMQCAAFEVPLVQIGDLQLTPWRRLDFAYRIDNAPVVKIQAGDGVVRFWRFRLFDDSQRAMGGVELDNAITFGIVNPTCEHGCPSSLPRGVAQQSP